ncbi:uncharacterized protein KQ657_002233 [Scheffersomyces spartinae]|uniref:Uncharacterized protein n=1 Tax=Scheffersomyces spartinae TaxID=45513 RepID=A0A9P7VE97_9ASCO|nr:uncharacterized protein KQ657_002233 [Scheffersomyces spartinae]KAG7195848.1 hypothetical protein KQ657_002233 [Scheffersomyces spartinae]
MPIVSRIDPNIKKALKVLVLLLAFRIQKPLSLTAFVALNPIIKEYCVLLQDKFRGSSHLKATAYKVANTISCILLYHGATGNTKIPKDYLSIYLWMTYLGILNKPSDSSIIVHPGYSKYFKVDTYESKWIHTLYDNKQLIIYPLIFGQILSNYLTPTKYKLNQRYLSSFIKSRILNPIWINYSLGNLGVRFNWIGVLKTYVKHNLVLLGIMLIMTFKNRFLDLYYELKLGVTNTHDAKTSMTDIIRNHLMYAFHKANGITNFIYIPNLLAIGFLSFTSPILRSKMLRSIYSNNPKLIFKSYIKSIGFISALIAVLVNFNDPIPAFGYDYNSKLDDVNTKNIRMISKSAIDGVNLYLIRLIILSKWRITKENHPIFTKVKLSLWDKLESITFALGFLKVMNLNDYINQNPSSLDYSRLKKESLIKIADRVM